MTHLGFIRAVSVDDLLPAACVLVDDPLLLVNKANLYCAVAVILFRLDLSHHTGTCIQDSYRDQRTVFVEDLGHSDLCRQNCFLHFSSLSAIRLKVYIADHTVIVAQGMSPYNRCTFYALNVCFIHPPRMPGMCSYV